MPDAWIITECGGVSLAVCHPLSEAGFLHHGFTLRTTGLNLSFRTEPDAAKVRLNRARTCHALRHALPDLTLGEQIHGSGLARVALADRGRGGASPDTAVPGTDGLITADEGLLLAVTVADCPPVLLADPEARAIAAVHSGWRGTAESIVPKAVERMCRELNARPERILAAIGPAICGACYETGPAVADRISEACGSRNVVGRSSRGRETVDLRAAIATQLSTAGVRPTNVWIAPWCTRCDGNLFFSHRGEGPMAGRLAGLIAID